MSRIDANVATQVGDSSRPYQAIENRRLQSQQAATDDANAPKGTVGADDLATATAQVKQVVEAASNRKLSFKVNGDTGDSYVIVSDEATGDVITQIPSEEMLRLHQRLSQMVGLFIDGQA